MNKSILLSKTFWLQIVTVVSMFVPAVNTFVVANPESAACVLGAANVLVRFFTSGTVSLTGGDGSTGSGTGATRVSIGLVTLAGLSGFALSACSPSQQAEIKSLPISGTVKTNYGMVSFDPAGVHIEVDATSGK